MAPLPTHPDPKKPVIVIVEALATGVEAFLSPLAFLSKKRTPVEQNYDIGNSELLAIK